MNRVILNIPHSGLSIPKYIREGIKLSEEELKQEINNITDLYTDRIFSYNRLGLEQGDSLVAEFNRLVCDIERFEDDSEEEMSKIGMGAVYTRTTDNKVLRELNQKERNHIIETYYRPYHEKLNTMVNKRLRKFDDCYILDCHSFNPKAEYLSKDKKDYADICIGTNMHTPSWLTELVVKEFKKDGYTVNINAPFSGTVVPLEHYNKDFRVKSIMIEVSRNVYMNTTKYGLEEDVSRTLKLSRILRGIINKIQENSKEQEYRAI